MFISRLHTHADTPFVIRCKEELGIDQRKRENHFKDEFEERFLHFSLKNQERDSYEEEDSKEKTLLDIQRKLKYLDNEYDDPQINEILASFFNNLVNKERNQNNPSGTSKDRVSDQETELMNCYEMHEQDDLYDGGDEYGISESPEQKLREMCEKLERMEGPIDLDFNLNNELQHPISGNKDQIEMASEIIESALKSFREKLPIEGIDQFPAASEIVLKNETTATLIGDGRIILREKTLRMPPFDYSIEWNVLLELEEDILMVVGHSKEAAINEIVLVKTGNNPRIITTSSLQCSKEYSTCM